MSAKPEPRQQPNEFTLAQVMAGTGLDSDTAMRALDELLRKHKATRRYFGRTPLFSLVVRRVRPDSNVRSWYETAEHNPLQCVVMTAETLAALDSIALPIFQELADD